ncbi:DHA2 family efflux MFS transporter permease subunit [Paraburkholderia oxyphila]|uniref:DHA2 family efflux MFS transporter permease subunit n=1 Tax=Paraburkholderia oxyphila TaxID=614212 RepID=UPI000B0DCC61|nr:DHA2 family efflux MFS transporter permease subunit [Paraburkholderia oxyphila]
MKATCFNAFGGPEVLTIAEFPDPHPGPGQVRIAVRAAGVNASDWKKRQGLMDQALPQTLGYEAAGIVDELGEGVTDVALGDRVFGFCIDGAAQAELAVLTYYAPIPSALDFAVAASLPAAIETAARALDQLHVTRGATLLINGASGNIGAAAIQLAVARGARVIGTASPANQEYVRTLGAEPVAYGEGMADRVYALAPEGVDLALDVAGNGILPELIELAGGPNHVITVADFGGAERYGVRFSRGDDGRALYVLAQIGELVTSGRFVLPAVHTFPLPEVAQAHRVGEAGRAMGKLVLLIDTPGDHVGRDQTGDHDEPAPRPENPRQPGKTRAHRDNPPSGLQSRGRGRWMALGALSLAQLMDVLDNTIVNIALPSAQHDLGFSTDNRQWIVTGYALAFGSLLLLGGRLSDLFGRKRMFLVGVTGFVIASAVGGAANGFLALLVARVAQGAFAAMLAPAALSLVSLIFADNAEDRGRAFGVFGAVSGVGGALGLLLGGVLTETVSWRWCLYVNLIFGVVALFGALAFVPRGDRSPRTRLDLPGITTAMLGLVGIVYGLGNAASRGWGDIWTLAPLAAGVILMMMFVMIERRVDNPLLPLSVVLDRVRGAAFLTLWICGMGMFAVFLFLTYYLQEILKFSPVNAGVAFLPMIGAVVMSSIVFGTALFPRTGPRPLVPIGCALAAAGMSMFTGISANASYTVHVLPALLVTGIGFGMIFSPVQNAATSGVHAHDAGVASAMVNTVQQVGGAIGIAAFNSLASTAVSNYLTKHADAATQPATLTRATLAGDHLVFWSAAGVFFAGGIVALLLFRNGPIPVNLYANQAAAR